MDSITAEALYLYCRADTEEQQSLALQLGETNEARLLAKGIPITSQNRELFGLTVKAMTLHDMDHPGEETPRGIREMINDLKFNIGGNYA